jgi:hypothetical protein
MITVIVSNNHPRISDKMGFSIEDKIINNDYSIAVVTFYLLRPLKLTNQNQSQIQSVQLFITFAT